MLWPSSGECCNSKMETEVILYRRPCRNHSSVMCECERPEPRLCCNRLILCRRQTTRITTLRCTTLRGVNYAGYGNLCRKALETVCVTMNGSKAIPNRKKMFIVALFFVMVIDCGFLWWNGVIYGSRLDAVRFYNKSGHRLATSMMTTPVPCQPKHRIVFAKTHKTGSSTMATIFERYGHNRELNFVLPNRSHVFSQFVKFQAQRAYLHDLKDKNGSLVIPAMGGYHILTNHARYNRPEQEALIPNAFYCTIIREPARQFESAFKFFRLYKYMPNHTLTDIFRLNPSSFYISNETKPMAFLRNGQMYDLGFEQQSQDTKSVDKKIKSLSEEMDLVMIKEYFDESLILLKNLLCWDFDDIIYISQLVKRQSKARKKLSADVTKKIYKWNHADVKLYQHFNETFWDKVLSYGPSFQRDLETFRDMKTATTEICLQNATVKLPLNITEKCRDLVRSDQSWVSILRKNLTLRAETFMNRKQMAAEQ